jgi:hypothetical protein
MAKKECIPRPPKPPVGRFSDGLASGKYVIVTDPKEVAELIAKQRGGSGTNTRGCFEKTYSYEI